MIYTSPSSTNAGILMSLQVIFLPSVILLQLKLLKLLNLHQKMLFLRWYLYFISHLNKLMELLFAYDLELKVRDLAFIFQTLKMSMLCIICLLFSKHFSHMDFSSMILPNHAHYSLECWAIRFLLEFLLFHISPYSVNIC